MTHTKDTAPPLMLYNTLTRTKEHFEPVHKDGVVRMYNCGPTVYNYVHVGNLRAYVFVDTLRRVLILNGYKVRQVMNITDVGHLAGDSDDGEDKMTLALKREGKPLTLEAMREVANIYTAAFVEDINHLNIKRPPVLEHASDHIHADIALVETLVQKGYAYELSDGVYFDIKQFKGYGKLGNIDTESLKTGARVEENTEKRNPADFALWKKNAELGWKSPWGRGFPGWHIECSAMAMEYLGRELDIHTGGIDNIGTHHNNEIAQSEAATGKPFARFWMHNEHIHIEGTKISKSLKNDISLRQIIEHGYHPLAYRYWLLNGHYRTPMNFSFTALDAAQSALKRLHRFFVDECLPELDGTIDKGYALTLLKAANDDLDTPKILATLWEIVKDDTLTPANKRANLLHYDKVLGLGLRGLAQGTTSSHALAVRSVAQEDIPEEVATLLKQREEARRSRDYAAADTFRELIEAQGYTLEDTKDGPVVRTVT